MTEEAFAAFDLRSRDGYCGFLAAQAGGVLPLEAWLGAQDLDAILPDWPSRRRGAALRADLATMGEPPPAAAPPCVSGDPLGVAYVLEGSRHGARILHRVVAGSSDPLLAQATCFLGQRFDPSTWAELLARLEAAASTPRRRDAIITAAIQAFGWFRRSAQDVATSIRAESP